MRQKAGPHGTAEAHAKEIHRATRRQHNAEEKIRVVLEGPRSEMRDLKEAPAGVQLENLLLKKA